MTTPSALRYFAALGLHPPYALVVLVAIVALGLWTVRLNPGELDSALGMLLFVQMFLASTGFAMRARQGHFDPVLTCASNRTAAMLSHWIVSIAPGVAGWVCVAGGGYFLGSPAAVSALGGTRAASLFIVSTVGWAGGFTLARGAAGVVWSAILLGLLLQRTEFLPSVPSASAHGVIALRQAATLILCPFLLLGGRPIILNGAVVVAVLLAAVVLMSAWRLAGSLDTYLVDHA